MGLGTSLGMGAGAGIGIGPIRGGHRLPGEDGEAIVAARYRPSGNGRWADLKKRRPAAGDTLRLAKREQDVSRLPGLQGTHADCAGVNALYAGRATAVLDDFDDRKADRSAGGLVQAYDMDPVRARARAWRHRRAGYDQRRKESRGDPEGNGHGHCIDLVPSFAEPRWTRRPVGLWMSGKIERIAR